MNSGLNACVQENLFTRSGDSFTRHAYFTNTSPWSRTLSCNCTQQALLFFHWCVCMSILVSKCHYKHRRKFWNTSHHWTSVPKSRYSQWLWNRSTASCRRVGHTCLQPHSHYSQAVTAVSPLVPGLCPCILLHCRWEHSWKHNNEEKFKLKLPDPEPKFSNFEK